MSRVQEAVVSLIFLVFASSLASAQRAVFVGENDGEVSITDRDYTSGFRGSIVFDDFSHEVLASQAFDLLKPALVTAGSPEGPKREQLEWIYLGQSIFTPDHTTLPVRLPGDRPYGGWLYTGFSAAQETAKQQLDSFELLAGVVGPDALGYEAQAQFHRLIGILPPVINGYEIKNEPGLLLAWDRRWKFGLDLSDSYGVDLIPAAGFTAGNVFTYASAGMIARFGRSLSTTWGPTLVRPGPSGASFISPNQDAPFWGFDFYAGFEGRAVARNIFLNGNTFEASPSVIMKPLVLDVLAGAEIFSQSGYSLAFTVVHRSPEYTTQPKSATLFGVPVTFGSISGSFRF
jgi:lipid A 3-O-deacylase